MILFLLIQIQLIKILKNIDLSKTIRASNPLKKHYTYYR